MKTFAFLGHTFDADRVATLVRTSGVLIKVKAEDMLTSDSRLVTDQHTYPCVVHHENMYHALSLPKDFRPGDLMNVKLISKPALKRFRA